MQIIRTLVGIYCPIIALATSLPSLPNTQQATINYEKPLQVVRNGGFETKSLDSWRLIAGSDSAVIYDPVQSAEGAYYLSAHAKKSNGENFVLLYGDGYEDCTSGRYTGSFEYRASMSGATGCTMSVRFDYARRSTREFPITDDVENWTKISTTFTLSDSNLLPEIKLSCSTGYPVLEIDNISIVNEEFV